MYKFIIYPILIVLLLFTSLDQLSNHAALIHYYSYKYAVNRATHAAAMQLDKEALADGHIVIDEYEAQLAARQLLNLNLEKDSYTITFFEVVHVESENVPYHYVNKQWNIELYLYKPAVILVISTELPHMIKSKPSFLWNIFGTSEVVSSFK